MIYGYLQFIEILFIGSFILLIGATLFYSICVDRLIRFEYKNYKDEWVKDGKPSGYFWSTSESSFWYGFFGRDGLAKKWLQEKPEWIQQDPKAIVLYNWLRWSIIIMILTVTLFAVLSFVFALIEKGRI